MGQPLAALLVESAVRLEQAPLQQEARLEHVGSLHPELGQHVLTHPLGRRCRQRQRSRTMRWSGAPDRSRSRCFHAIARWCT